jgi:hypothetical protein
VTAGRRQRVGTTTTSSSAKRHPSSSGGGASTFRASSSRKRVRVGGRPSLSSSVSASGRTIYPSSVLSSSAAILNRARPVSRSEALVGEYTARAILRSSVNGGGGGANELLRSSTRSTTTSYHYYRPMTGEIGDGETEEGEEEWVEEARLDEFGAALPTSGHDTQVRMSALTGRAFDAATTTLIELEMRVRPAGPRVRNLQVSVHCSPRTTTKRSRTLQSLPRSLSDLDPDCRAEPTSLARSQLGREAAAAAPVYAQQFGPLPS